MINLHKHPRSSNHGIASIAGTPLWNRFSWKFRAWLRVNFILSFFFSLFFLCIKKKMLFLVTISPRLLGHPLYKRGRRSRRTTRRKSPVNGVACAGILESFAVDGISFKAAALPRQESNGENYFGISADTLRLELPRYGFYTSGMHYYRVSPALLFIQWLIRAVHDSVLHRWSTRNPCKQACKTNSLMSPRRRLGREGPVTQFFTGWISFSWL